MGKFGTPELTEVPISIVLLGHLKHIQLLGGSISSTQACLKHPVSPVRGHLFDILMLGLVASFSTSQIQSIPVNQEGN